MKRRRKRAAPFSFSDTTCRLQPLFFSSSFHFSPFSFSDMVTRRLQLLFFSSSLHFSPLPDEPDDSSHISTTLPANMSTDFSQYTDPSTSGKHVGQFLSLRHPKTGNISCYLFTGGVLQELHWFKQSYGSWFLGDYVCEDGRLYIATPVDPVFILLPIFEEARMKKGDDPGKFRQLDEIVYIDGFPGYRSLLSIAEKSMQIVCDIKEIGSTKFFRLNDLKVLKWLCYKVHQLKKTLPTLDKNYAARDEKDTLFDAVSVVGEYLKEEPWLNLLCSKFKLNLQEAVNTQYTEVVLHSNGSGPGSFNPVQESTKVDKKTVRSTRQTKKAKVEENSKNIKDMFSRAARKGR